MSGSATGYSIVPLRANVGSNAAVRTAITKILHDVFGYLGTEWRDTALGWMGADEYSYLKINPDEPRAPAAALWVDYTSGEWYRRFAEHVVEFSLAWARQHIEIELAKLGFSIDPAQWPVLDEVISRGTFVMHEGKLGHLDEGDDGVRWHAGWNVTHQELDEIPPAVRARLDAHARCECPLCTRFAESLWPAMTVRSGHHATRVQVWGKAEHLLAPRTGGQIFVGSIIWMGAAWALRSVAGHAPWITIEQLGDRRNRFVELLHATSNAHVALLATDAGHPREASVSRDGGATWSDPAPIGLPKMKKTRTTTHAHRPDVVHVITPNTKPSSPLLYRSNDGGLTFGEPIRPTIAGVAPKSIEDVITFDECMLITATPKKGQRVLAKCDDATNDFTPQNIPDFLIGQVSTSTSGVVVLFGLTRDMRRSRDQGRTWTAHAAPAMSSHAVLGGRWFVIEPNVGIHVSDDEGDTWTLIAEGAFTKLCADHADPSSVYALIGGVAMHVVL